jgi:hypothetical protein
MPESRRRFVGVKQRLTFAGKVARGSFAAQHSDGRTDDRFDSEIEN